jgi:hypothetical protein
LQMNEEKRYYGNDMLAVAEPWKVMLFDAQWSDRDNLAFFTWRLRQVLEVVDLWIEAWNYFDDWQPTTWCLPVSKFILLIASYQRQNNKILHSRLKSPSLPLWAVIGRLKGRNTTINVATKNYDGPIHDLIRTFRWVSSSGVDNSSTNTAQQTKKSDCAM